MKKLLLAVLIALFAVAAWQLHLRRKAHRGTTGGETLTFYCAAGVKPPVSRLCSDYEDQYGADVQLQFGGSGTLLSNLKISRQGDLYIAADESYMRMAQDAGLVAETLPLAYMTPVIAVPKGNPKNVSGIGDLMRPDLRIALGNPDAASIGKQTRAMLEEAGVWKDVKQHVEAKGVFKPTVPEVANDVKLGAVDAAVVWDATVNQYDNLEAVQVPEFDRYRKQTTVGVLKSSKNPTAALRLARYLNSRIGNRMFRDMGYEAVDGDVWALHPEITFFCGAVNRRAIEEVILAFEKREGVTVNTVYNGCGILTGQMRTIRQDQGGAGFPDVYMACDRYYLENVREWFQEDADISHADIVLAVPKGNPANIQSLDDLTREGIRVSVGQPEQCTIGALTRIMLQKSGIYNQVMSNVVMQTASSSMLIPTVTTKSVDVTIAYITDTKAESDKVDAVTIDLPFAVAIQPFSIAKSSDHKYLGRRLFKTIAEARKQFEEAGFEFVYEQP